jgi:predicted nucleic acid-binding protein
MEIMVDSNIIVSAILFPNSAAAIESNADILITGDKDFDEITIDRPMIMKPRKFADEYIN